MSKIKKELLSQLEKVEKDVTEINLHAKSNTNDIIQIAESCKSLEDLINNNFSFIKEYNKALAFLNWFDFEMLSSDKLAKEAFNKKYADLRCHPLSFKSYDYKIDFNISATAQETLNKIGYLSVDPAANTLTTSALTIQNNFDWKSMALCNEDIMNKKLSSKPKVKYEDKVGCVWERPFNYNENIVLSVYQYLKEVLNTSKTVSKYNDK